MKLFFGGFILLASLITLVMIIEGIIIDTIFLSWVIPIGVISAVFLIAYSMMDQAWYNQDK